MVSAALNAELNADLNAEFSTECDPIPCVGEGPYAG